MVIDEGRFYLQERCLGFPWWRLEVKRDRPLTVGGKKGGGSPAENSQPYHEKMTNNITACIGHYCYVYVNVHLFVAEANYNNGKILSAAVTVTSPGTGSMATEVILSPSVTTTYRYRIDLSTVHFERDGTVKRHTLDLGPPSKGVASKSIPSARVNSALSSAMNRTLVPSGAIWFFHAL